ncbi:hypothetical protein GGS24DRAFT_235738 [Hypoxylon argillaceum]|nr:hypothetical protein GGS24DRAFT_235738 [Hypoxylon argillaceum]KAI1154796.1 hypothetical protein F4825DRAFT_146470 [Nemania diffusa]
MHSTLYVLVYPSRLFAAHWSFWLPYKDGKRESNVGDRIHVTGDRLNGFEYEYIRGYNKNEDDRHPNAYPIGLVSDVPLKNEDFDSMKTAADEPNLETHIHNAFDKACREVSAPGPSLNRVNGARDNKSGAPPPPRTQVKDCQWWLQEAALKLVQSGILLPLNHGDEMNGPIARISSLPRH